MFDAIIDFFDMGQHIIDLCNAAFSFWNACVRQVFKMLGMLPEEFQGGNPWRVIEQINPIFVGVGSSLVVLFFIIGFCSESIDIKEELRFESILRFLLRLGVAEWLVINNVTILKAVFKSVGALVNLLSDGAYTSASLSLEAKTAIESLNFGQGLILLLFTLIAFLVMVICALFLIYTVYVRFLKILVIVPFGSVASSTLSGNRMVSHTAVSYFKYFLSVVLEAVTIALSIIVSNAILSYGIFDISGRGTGWTGSIMYLLEMCFISALTVGSVKGAQQLTQKVLGLG